MGTIIHHICRGHCPWSKNVHVEQFCSTWNFSEVMWNKITSHDNHSCCTWQNYLSCGVILACGSMTNCSFYQILVHVTNLQCVPFCCDLCCFDAKSILTRFTRFWRKIHFDAIYALLCGAKNNQQILSVEHKWQIWCMTAQHHKAKANYFCTLLVVCQVIGGTWCLVHGAWPININSELWVSSKWSCL